MRTCAFFFAFLTIVGFLGGCREQSTEVGGKMNPKRYQTAVSLNPGVTEILRSRMSQLPLIGRTAQCNWPTQDPKVEIVMNGVKPNYEKIAQMRPGIVVYDEQLFSRDDIEKIAQLGIDTFAVKGDTIKDFVDCLYDMGRMFHGETQVIEYVGKIESAMAEASGAPPAKKLKVAVMIPGQGGEHLIAGLKTLQADAVRAAQGEPVGPDANKFVPVNAEALVAMNPDVIVTGADPRPIFQDPRLQSVSAIKSGKAAQIKNPDILLRRGGRVDELISLLYRFLSGPGQR